MERRAFFQKGAGLLLAASAYAFGEKIAAEPAKERGTNAILYGTRYGATRDTAGWIAEGMGGQVELIDIAKADFDRVLSYDRLVIGSGIWIDGPHKRLTRLLEERRKTIEPKIAASFVVCGTTGEDEAGRERIRDYLRRLHAPLEHPPKLSTHFGGRMIIARLTPQDRKLLEHFYRDIVKKPFTDWDRTQPRAAKAFGKRVQDRTLVSGAESSNAHWKS